MFLYYFIWFLVVSYKKRIFSVWCISYNTRHFIFLRQSIHFRCFHSFEVIIFALFSYQKLFVSKHWMCFECAHKCFTTRSMMGLSSLLFLTLNIRTINANAQVKAPVKQQLAQKKTKKSVANFHAKIAICFVYFYNWQWDGSYGNR